MAAPYWPRTVGLVDELERLSQGKYLSLTTFRKTGEGVATPVWVVRDGDHLYVTTQADSGKVKRLRNNPKVSLAPCDARGKLTGPAVAGTVVLLDTAGSQQAQAKVMKRYGMTGRLIGLANKLRRGSGESIGLEITPES